MGTFLNGQVLLAVNLWTKRAARKNRKSYDAERRARYPAVPDELGRERGLDTASGERRQETCYGHSRTT
jgi:hypothetical protein